MAWWRTAAWLLGLQQAAHRGLQLSEQEIQRRTGASGRWVCVTMEEQMETIRGRLLWQLPHSAPGALHSVPQPSSFLANLLLSLALPLPHTAQPSSIPVGEKNSM